MGLARRWMFRILHSRAKYLSSGASLLTYASVGTIRYEQLRKGIQNWWDEQLRQAPQAIVHFELSAQERDFYSRFLTSEDSILLIGCGGGRDLGALLELGYQVEGLDISSRGIELAAINLGRLGLKTALHAGGIEGFILPRAYDAFVFSLLTYGMILQSSQRVRVLIKLKQSLTLKG